MFTTLDAVDVLRRVREREVDVDHARIEAPVHRPPGLGEHGQHAPVVGERLRGESLDAVRLRDRREVFEQQRRDAAPLAAVVDHERDLGVVAVLESFVARPRDEIAVVLDHERDPVDEVDVGETSEIRLAQRGFRREEAPVPALGGLPNVELGECRRVVGGDRADRRRGAVTEHDGGRPTLVWILRHDGGGGTPCRELATNDRGGRATSRRRSLTGRWIDRSACSTPGSAGSRWPAP